MQQSGAVHGMETCKCSLAVLLEVYVQMTATEKKQLFAARPRKTHYLYTVTTEVQGTVRIPGSSLYALLRCTILLVPGMYKYTILGANTSFV